MMDVWVQKLLRHVTPLLRKLGKEFPPHPPPLPLQGFVWEFINE